jgi:hypothetical protein
MARKSRPDAYKDPDAYRFRDDRYPGHDDEASEPEARFSHNTKLSQITVPTANDCNAIATFALTAGLIEQPQAEGVARTLMRSFQASPTGCRITTPSHFRFSPMAYTPAALRAVAVMIDAATHGHEDPAILSQRILAAILSATS